MNKTQTLEYKGFAGEFNFDKRDKLFVGKIIHLEDFVTFQGTNIAELEQNFRESVEFHIEISKKS